MKRKQIKEVSETCPDKEWWEEVSSCEFAGIPKEKIAAKVIDDKLVIEGHSTYRYLREELELANFPGDRNSFSIRYHDGLLLIDYEPLASIQIH